MIGAGAALAGRQGRPHDPDSVELLALIEGCANPGITRRALMVRTAELPPQFAFPYRRRAIEAALEPLLRLDRARLFHLADGGLVVAWRGPGGGEEQSARETLAKLLSGLADDAVELLDLPGDAERLTQAVDGTLGLETHRDAGPPGRPLDLASLASLERAMAHVDVAAFTRRKPVCRCMKGRPPVIAWEKRQLAVDNLAAALAPGIAPQADPWLFRRLTRSFDRRMLALLSAPDELRDAGPFSLDLNVTSIVGPEFLRFDAALPRGLRGEVVLGVLPADVMTDPSGFAFARDYAHARGYRLLLRSVALDWVEIFPMDVLKVDLMQVVSPADSGWALPAGISPATVVLSKVADGKALERGREQGVELFEGRALGAGRARGAAPRFPLGTPLGGTPWGETPWGGAPGLGLPACDSPPP